MKYTNIPMYDKILGIFIGEVFLDITSEHITGIYPYYSISNFGRVYHKGIGRLLSLGMTSNGYLAYPFSTINGYVNARIHRLEMIVFNPIPGYQDLIVNHKDGNKLNLYIGNLEWATRSENTIHAFSIGLNPKGECSSSSKITEKQVLDICERLQNGESVVDISNKLGISKSIIQHIKNKDTWKEISSSYNFSYRKRILFTEDQIRSVCEYFANNDIGDKSIKQHSADALIFSGIEVTDANIDSIRKVYTREYYSNISTNYVF